MTEFRDSHLPGLADAWRNLPEVMRGILLMCCSTVLFSSMHVLVRFASQEMHPLQVAFFRNLFGIVVFLPILLTGGRGFLRPQRLLDVLNRTLIVSPEAHGNLRERGLLYQRLECYRAALKDLQDYSALEPEAPDIDDVRSLVLELSARCARLN